MNYLDDTAQAIKALVPQDLLPDGDTETLFRIYAVLALAKGPQVDSEDVHNAWVAWMAERDPDHSSLKPFEELDADTRRSDEPYVQAIRAVAAEHGAHPA
jgi:hypothetical protein